MVCGCYIEAKCQGQLCKLLSDSDHFCIVSAVPLKKEVWINNTCTV